MSDFHTKGFQVIENLVDTSCCALLSAQIKLMRDNLMYQNRDQIKNSKIDFFANDPTVTNSFSLYGSLISDAVLDIVKPKIESIVGKKLYSSYTYTRINYHGGVLEPHYDRPSSEYAVTMTVDIDNKPWDICVQDLIGDKYQLSLNVGSACLYLGTKIPHWREPYEGQEQVQIMMFFVDANGQYAHEKYDGRPLLGSSSVK